MDEPEAGRNLDALIAEKVFGYDVARERRIDGEVWIVGRPFADKTPVPAYSTEIAAAWLVMQHLNTQGWYLSLEANRGHWYVCAARASLLQRYAQGDTAPLAICRAALAAVEPLV